MSVKAKRWEHVFNLASHLSMTGQFRIHRGYSILTILLGEFVLFLVRCYEIEILSEFAWSAPTWFSSFYSWVPLTRRTSGNRHNRECQSLTPNSRLHFGQMLAVAVINRYWFLWFRLQYTRPFIVTCLLVSVVHNRYLTCYTTRNQLESITLKKDQR